MANPEKYEIQPAGYADNNVLITGMHRPVEFVIGHSISFGMALGCGSGAFFVLFAGAAPSIPIGAFFGMIFGFLAGLFDGIVLATIVSITLRLTRRNFPLTAHAIRWLTPFVTLVFAYLLFHIWSRYSAWSYIWISDYTHTGAATALVVAGIGGYILADKFEKAFNETGTR